MAHIREFYEFSNHSYKELVDLIIQQRDIMESNNITINELQDEVAELKAKDNESL